MNNQPPGTPPTIERPREADDGFPDDAQVFDLYELNIEQLGWYEQFDRPEIIGRRETNYLINPAADDDDAGLLSRNRHIIIAHEPVLLIRGRLRCLTYSGSVKTLPDDWRISTAKH